MPVVLQECTLRAGGLIPAADVNAGAVGAGGLPVLDIGLVNNMPDAALDSTERQFVELLDGAARDVVVRLPRAWKDHLLSARPRGAPLRVKRAGRLLRWNNNHLHPCRLAQAVQSSRVYVRGRPCEVADMRGPGTRHRRILRGERRGERQKACEPSPSLPTHAVDHR